MKETWIAKGMKWIGVALAVSVGIYVTGSAWCLWALLIPVMGD